jgi:hypothetical protein
VINLRFILTPILMLLSSAPVFAQAVHLSQPSALLEIAFTFERDCGWQSQTTRVYVDGLVINEAKYQRRARSGKCHEAFLRMELRLEPEELAELISWTEQPDFLNAPAELVVRSGECTLRRVRVNCSSRLTTTCGDRAVVLNERVIDTLPGERNFSSGSNPHNMEFLLVVQPVRICPTRGHPDLL